MVCTGESNYGSLRVMYMCIHTLAPCCFELGGPPKRQRTEEAKEEEEEEEEDEDEEKREDRRSVEFTINLPVAARLFAQSYCEADQQGDKRDTDVALALLPRSLLTSSKAKYKNYSSEVPRGASFLDSHLCYAMEGALSAAENQNVAPREAELP
ncbi:hypothetical protein M0804_000835 [Polistes exclamans]|nr:hypothetical protein M0804_000835 [Polistes exclamans]